MTPTLSVLVCSYNGAELLPLCLTSLAEQTLDPALFEVIVVNNNSTDDTHSIAEAFAARHHNFRVVFEAEQGLSHARNRWREARGEYVAYLDDDAKASPQWCERLLEAFATVTPSPAAVGGEIRPFYESTPPRWFTDDFERRSWGADAGFLAPSQARYGFSGSNMAFPREVLAEAGGFSPRFGMIGPRTRMGEDTELFLRLYQKHPRFWYDPRLTVYHWVPTRNMTLSYRMLRNYRTGESMAAISGRRIASLDYLGCLGGILYLIAATPFRLLAHPVSARTAAAKSCEDLAGKLGYLMAKLS